MSSGPETNKLSPLLRVGTVIAAGALLLTQFFPLWRISLWAPQYPEGLNLYIWANKLTGDIQTVNILNHYIGMAAISEASFPELKFFLPVFYGLSALGLLAAIIGRVQGLYVWVTALLGFACWSFYDFWAWEYKFGHELSPDAAIKMDDMVYQPPLIGQKIFLNITAESWPELAGLAFALVVLFAVGASIWTLISKARARKVQA